MSQPEPEGMTPDEEEATSSEAIGLAVRGATARATVVLLSMLVAETAVRWACGAAHFPSLGTAAVELASRAGRISVLALALAVCDLALSAVGSIHALASLARFASGSLSRLCEPARVLRLGIVYAVALILFARTSELQLPWHAGAVNAMAALAGAGALELGVAALRRRRAPPSGASQLGASLWTAGLLAFGTLVAYAVGQPELGAATTALAASCFVRAALPQIAPRQSIVMALVLAMVASWMVVARAPAVRRFASAYTPYSALGLEILARATDVDGDGSSAWFGLDCDELDGTKSAFFVDLPNDGMDQNCRGGDASFEHARLRYLPGTGAHAPLPEPSELHPYPVVIITVDALRADAFDDGTTMPRTLAWARSCYRFSRAYANANSTGGSLLSLHTGLYLRHFVTPTGGWFIDLAAPKAGKLSHPPTLAAALAVAGGYATSVVFPAFHADNFDFLTGYTLGKTLPPSDSSHFPTATTMLAEARKRLAESPPGKPAHLRVHLMDTHAPYPGGSNRAAYLRGARSLDEPLARFLTELPSDAVVVLSADHGEAFGEHGFTEHGSTLFEPDLRVPLVLCAPKAAELGVPRVISTPVSLVDVTPTVLELTGVSAPYQRHGESLVPLLATGTAKRAPWVFFEHAEGGAHGVLLGCEKLLEDNRYGYRALFDVCRDPAELDDLTTSDPASAERMDRLLTEIVDLDLDSFRSYRIGQKNLVEFSP